MALERFLGLNNNQNRKELKDAEDASEITKPLRKLSDGELLLGVINVIYLTTITDKQAGLGEAKISLDDQKLGNLLPRLGVSDYGKENITSIKISYLEGEEEIGLENGGEKITFEAKQSGRYWIRVKHSEKDGKKVRAESVVTKERLKVLRNLVDVYKNELELINRGGSL